GSRVELHDLPFVVDGDDAVQGRVQDRRFAGLALPQGELGLPRLRHVPEGEDHAYRLAARTPDRSGAVVNRPFGPVLGEQHGMIAQADDGTLPEYPGNRVLHRLAGSFVQNGENVAQGLSLGLALPPPGQGLGNGVEVADTAPGVRGDDRIADAGERDPQPLPLLPQRLFRLLALGNVPGDFRGTDDGAILVLD